MEIWAICRSDHGLSWDEFCDLTLAQFEALEERRAIRIRHRRHDAAFIVSTLLNLNRGTTDSDWISPYDFLPGFERDPEEVEAEERRKNAIRSVRFTFLSLKNASQERVLEVREKLLSSLRGQGFSDPEAMMTEAFPNL